MSIDQETTERLLNFLIANAVNDALTLGLADELGGEVIHISSTIPRHLNLSIANTLTEEVRIVGQPGPPSCTNYHFHIQFPNNLCLFSPPATTLRTSGWQMYAVSNGDGYITDIYLLSTDTITLTASSSKGSTTSVDFLYTDATLENADVDVLVVTITLGQNVIALLKPNPQPVTGTETIHLITFTDASAPTPLIAALVRPRTILNDKTEQNLLLRLVNTSPDPVKFVPPSEQGGKTPTAIELTVDIDDGAAWALCKSDEAGSIQVTPPSNWAGDPGGVIGTRQKTWLFRPDYSNTNTKIDPNSALEFLISGVKTTLPPGFTNLYVTFREFQNYGTQTTVTQIEKSPLIYNSGLNSGLLSRGTTGPNQGLSINGDTTVDLFVVEQSGTGSSAHFKGGTGVSIENYLEVSGDARINDHTLWFRQDSDKNHGIGFYGSGKPFANSDVNGPAVFGFEGGVLGSTDGGERIALSWKNTGNVGIGTFHPKSTLSVKGGVAVGSTYADDDVAPQNSLLVEGNVGIGTNDPKSTLSVKGGIAVGATYAGAQVAPSSSLLVEGQVGIGTTKPLGPLSVGDASVTGSDGYIVVGKKSDNGTRQYRIGFDENFNFVIGDYGYGNIAAKWQSPFAMFWSAPTNSLYIDGNGHVGIGTAKPLGPLSIGDASVAGSDGYIVVGKKTDNGTRQYRMGFDENFNFVIGDYGENNVAGTWTAPFGMAWFAPNHSLFIDGNGRVGIGTNTPSKAVLEISGYGPGIPLDFGFMGNNQYIWTTSAGAGGVSLSMYASNYIAGQGICAFSDERIKRIVGRSDAASDLATLMGIEVTDYSYIDSLSNGIGTHKKLIGQQVLKVFPQAVSRSTDVVPDIYKKAAIRDGWVQLATNLNKGERVRLIAGKNEGIHEILEVAEGQFRTDFVTEGDQVFAYGREVNDFLNIDYDAIAMLNVSATQQIKREKDAEIQALKEEHAAMRARLDQLEQLMERFVLSEALESHESKVIGSVPPRVSGWDNHQDQCD